MLQYGHSYFITNRDDEMIYKQSYLISILELVSAKRKRYYENLYENFNDHIIGNTYVNNNMLYKCIDIDIYYGFVYDIDQLNYEHISCYIKDINTIKPISKFNSGKVLNLNNLINSNNVNINKQLEEIKKIKGLLEFQNNIRECMFLYRNGVNNKNITLFNNFSIQLSKLDSDFYVFRKQRLSEFYNPFKQFNDCDFENYALPFSTSLSYNFVKKWSTYGLILVIRVPKTSNYMVLYDQKQHEITLGPGNLVYKEKGFYNSQAIILCDYVDKTF